MKKQFHYLIKYSMLVFFILGCNEEKNNESKPNSVTKKEDTLTTSNNTIPTPTVRPPIINITDTVSQKKIVICMKDSAATIERVSYKFGQIFGKDLTSLVAKNKMKVTGPPIAWYISTKSPFFFEAGFPVEKISGKLPAKVIVKEIGADSVVVAHFYGPYSDLPIAYEALHDWLKEHNKKLSAKPYEIYVGDPVDKEGKPIDPYKVQTDVVFPWK